MNPTSKWTIALALWPVAANAQLPSANDSSDGYGNTGMGTDAAYHNCSPNYVCNGVGTAVGNTGAGYSALYSNEDGVNNTAIGYDALFGGTSAYTGTGNNKNTAAGY